MTTNTPNLPSKERMRLAVTMFFIAQGMSFATFFSRLPDIKNYFDINDFSHLGYLLSFLPIGKFAAIPAVGFLLPRIKSKLTTTISLLGFIVSLFVIGLASDIYILGIFLFLFGMFWNMTDISLNTQSIEVERIYGKAIMATFHASWSIAAVIGALIGYLLINFDLSVFNHFSIMAVVALVIVILNFRSLKNGAAEQKEIDAIKEEIEKEKGKKFRLPETLLIQLGLIWLIALVVENTIFDWSDIYFESVIKAPNSLRIGFLICMVMISIGRFLANSAYRIWTKTTVLKVAGSFLFIGFMMTAIFFNIENMTLRLIINSIGFMFIGLGISCVVPTIYSIVGDKSKTPIGTALTIMSSISFVGPLIAPLLVGEVSKHWNMHWAFMIIGLFGLGIVLIVALSKNLNRKD